MTHETPDNETQQTNVADESEPPRRVSELTLDGAALAADDTTEFSREAAKVLYPDFAEEAMR